MPLVDFALHESVFNPESNMCETRLRLRRRTGPRQGAKSTLLSALSEGQGSTKAFGSHKWRLARLPIEVLLFCSLTIRSLPCCCARSRIVVTHISNRRNERADSDRLLKNW